MPRALVNLDDFDLTRDVMAEEELRAMVPHRHEFMMLDGVCHLDVERGICIAYKDWGADAWWARGHIPGRPLMPGVLMVESCAQVSTILMKKRENFANDSFIGLGGLDDVRFRGQVTPPCRVYMVTVAGGETGRRILRYPAQCFVDGQMVMQMELMGVAL